MSSYQATLGKGKSNGAESRRPAEFMRRHRSWDKSWHHFSAAVTGRACRQPYRDASGVLKWKMINPPRPPPTQLFQVIMGFCKLIPAITSTDVWDRRQDPSLPTNPEVAEQWTRVLTRHLSEDSRIDAKAMEELVSVYSRTSTRELAVQTKILEEKRKAEMDRERKELGLGTSTQATGRPKTAFRPEFDDSKIEESMDDDEDVDDGLTPVLRRMITAQVLNALAMSANNTFVLLQYDILETMRKSLTAVPWTRTDSPRSQPIDTREYAAMQQLCEFLVKSGDVGSLVGMDRQSQYRGRDWARAAYRVCHIVLDPGLSEDAAPRDMKQSLEHVFTACFVRISPERSPTFFGDHTSAVFEVPGFMNRLAHWFYRREHLRQPGYGSSAEFITEIINALQTARENNTIPGHHKKSLQKALHYNQACATCNTKNPEAPLLETCPNCLGVFYCNEECRTGGFRAHSKTCSNVYGRQQQFN